MKLLDNEGDVEEELDEENEQLRAYKADLQQLEEICWRLICGEGDFKRGTNRTMLHKHVTCFSGSDLVTWIFTDVGSASRSEVLYPFTPSLSHTTTQSIGLSTGTTLAR